MTQFDFEESSEDEVTEKRLNPRWLLLGLAAVVMVIALIAIFAGSLTAKVTTVDDTNSTADSTTSTSPVSVNSEEPSVKPEDRTPESTETDSPSPVEVEAAPSIAQSSAEPKLIDESAISGEFSAKGTVSEKYVLKKNNSALFTLSIHLTTEKGGSANVEYYTTKSGYDTVKKGDIFNVTYGSGPSGEIAILTLTKS